MKNKMSKESAWKNFYKAVKIIKECEMKANVLGYSCTFSKTWKMAEMRAKRYGKVLVFVYGWQDIHTKKYVGSVMNG